MCTDLAFKTLMKLEKLDTGFWAGILATGPMTLALFELQKDSPGLRNSPLPPARMTTESLQPMGIPQNLNSRARVDLTMLSHFGYGVACALIYTFASKRLPGKPAARGSLFGAAVWAVSYLGWIPMFGFKTSAYHLSFGRNMQMLIAHLVWGASLGIAEHELRSRGKVQLDAGPVR